MADAQNMSIVTELIREVEGYLPNMRDFLRGLSKDTTNETDVKELHRMAHTIKGAAAMVQLDELSKTAALMEDVLDDILAGKQVWNSQLIEVMNDTVDNIGSFCASLHKGKADGGELYQTTFDAFEGVSNSFSAHSAASDDSILEEDLFALLGDDEEDESTGDFFHQLSAEEESTDPGDDLESLLGAADNDSGDVDLLPEQEEALPPQLPGIDPKLQACFNEEAAEHLENLGRQLNRLSSLITDPVSISDEFREKLHSIRRSVHTLKGAAAVIGIQSVADWGHDFEDFLDWLHDESHTLSAETILAMQDGADILEEIAFNPTVNVAGEISWLKDTFQDIMDESSTSVETIQEQSPLQLPDDAKSVNIDIDPDTPAADGEQTPAIDLVMEEVFREEAEEHLENIGRQLNVLSSSVTSPMAISNEYRSRLHSIRRSVHALKGAAVVAGISSVADWSHDFENFLDWLHDTSDTLSPDIITVLLEGGNTIEKMIVNPERDIDSELERIKNACRSIMVDSPPINDGIDTNIEKTQPLVADHFHRVEKTEDEAAKTRKNRQQPRSRTLRVGVEKISKLIGLSGDMSINLSSFENALFSMQAGLTELELTQLRLRSIASSLESGYELASIPHLGTAAGSSQDEYGINDEFDPLEMDRYSELHILIRSLNEAVVDLDSIRKQTVEGQGSWGLAVDRQRRVVSEMQGAVQSIQVTSFSTLANRLYKTVRESARATGKKVRLLIEGGSIEMDTHILDVLADALMQMLRNSVDHGVETLQERRLAGKKEHATIRINCSRRGYRFVLRLSDDGSGLDYDAIRRKIAKLNPAADVEQMDNRELASHIFTQGFSIREQVTAISGRGVGMDVVSNAVDQLDGFIEVQSNPGQGTDFILSIPIAVDFHARQKKKV